MSSWRSVKVKGTTESQSNEKIEVIKVTARGQSNEELGTIKGTAESQSNEVLKVSQSYSKRSVQ
jgi:hypothetical protein